MTWHGALGLSEDEAATPIDRSDRPESARRIRRRRRRAGRGADGKRLDVQGLRAVAVAAVVVNHLTGHPQGGFVGVDVFFVISGFLITGHLLRENAKAGRISLIDFYKRRIRRLFPAALLVIALTIAGGYLVFGAERARTTLTDGLFSAIFLQNWHLIDIGTDYFAGSGPVSPLQHYWSLSVEEQYYVVWPLLLMLALALVRRGGSASKSRAAGIAIGVLVVASLTIAVVQSQGNAVVAYFSTFTRMWELGIGAALAVAAPYIRGTKRMFTIMSAAGLAVIAVSLFVVSENHFPWPGALLPVLGAALVIGARGGDDVAAVNKVLTHKVSVYLGDISYTIYLVHFPVIIFAGVLVDSRSLLFYFAAVTILLGLSVLLYHTVENPIRQSNWLQPTRGRGENVRDDARPGRAAAIGAAFALAGCVAYVLFPSNATAELQQQIEQAQRNAAALAADSGSADAAAAFTPEVATLQSQLSAALLATRWPTLSPPIDATDPGDDGCPSGFKALASCTYGPADAPHTFYLVGDSTSGRYNNAFAAAVGQLDGWKAIGRGGAGCPFAATVLNESDGNQHAADCLPRNDAIVREIQSVKPDILVLTVTKMTPDFQSSIAAELQKVQGSYGKLVVLNAPPKGDDPQDCYTTLSSPTDCANGIASNFGSLVLTGSTALADQFDGTMIDTRDWFCAAGYCPAFAGTTPMRRDTAHITEAYSTKLGPVVAEVFTDRGLLKV